MVRKLFVLPLLAACFVPASAQIPAAANKAAPAKASAPARKSALDKATMEAYVRHLFVMAPAIKVEVLDPKPSSLPGFVDVTVRASAGPQSQDFHFHVSKDGQKIVQGNVYDVAQNPFKKEIDLLRTEGQPSFGTPGAPVVLVEFSDYQCPFCAETTKMLRENLLSAYPTQVRLYFKDFPLEQIHPWAKPAAMAGRCIFRQNPAAFWEFHDWIFSSQSSMTAENLKAKVLEWANGKEVDALQLGRCIDTRATEAEVNRDVADAMALKLNSTPTLFVNGRRMVGRLDWPTLRSVIDYEIEYQKTSRNAGEEACCELKPLIPGVPGN
jgi:protein-disulfide isomerase